MGDHERFDLLIRLDAGPSIGSGHFMRCLAYAAAAEGLGLKAAFVVSDGESAAFAESRGRRAMVIRGDKKRFCEHDGCALAECASKVGAKAVIVDSYAVSEAFFAGLGRGFAGSTAYIDDLYLFSSGKLAEPERWGVTHVINYSFGASLEEYEGVYGRASELLVGPSYAPVRPEFAGRSRAVDGGVSRILVTSGATNPGCFLERSAISCLQALPDVDIDVVVGAMAEVSEPLWAGPRVFLHHDVPDMSSLMAAADIAVSAAGSTLYELACMGVPTIAIPIVENQESNARGFRDSGAGLSLESPERINDLLGVTVRRIAADRTLRTGIAERARAAVDGLGGRRVVDFLFTGGDAPSRSDLKNAGDGHE